MAVYYQAEYRRTYQGTEGPVARDLEVQKARAQSLLGIVQPRIASMDRCLDIGCSAGQVLQLFKDQYGSKPVGIEPGDAYRTYAQGLGMIVYPSLDELESAGEKSFDMISMSHVLEHLADPIGYLQHLQESLIVPTGWLLVEVPNLYAHDSFEMAHLIAYSPHTLYQTLEKAGFDIVYLETHGRPRSDWLSLYITLLARPKTEESLPFRLVPERGVVIKRQAGMFYRYVIERIFSKRVWISQDN